MNATVSATQRFTKDRPCPVCGGNAGLPSGHGRRCYGFLSADSVYAHCTRDEHAHGLPQENGGSYAHRLDGPCKCGHAHGGEPPSANGHEPEPPPRRTVRERRWRHAVVGGEPIEHVRLDYDDGTKRVWWMRGGENGLRGYPVADLPLYGADQIGDASGVVIVEGEPARDALEPLARELGYAVVATVTGAKTRPSDAMLSQLPDLPLVPWADSDDDGDAHMRGIAQALVTLGRPAPRRIVWPDARPGEGDDAADFVNAGGTPDALAALLADAAPDVTGVTDVTRFPGARADALLDDVETFLGRFVAYPSEHARVAHTLWIAHAHLIDAFESTPRIAFLSPEPASGKTRALEVTELLVPRPVEAINVSAAYLFRKVDDAAGLPTILFDEVDTVFGPKAREHEDVRGLLNAGHRKGAVAGRCVIKGKTVETVEYSAYCAVALAGIGDLPETILTRAVVIRMRRRARQEWIEPFRRRLALPAGHNLRDRLAAWAATVRDRLTTSWPEMPDGVEDRAADVWEALLAVADAVGGCWPERARVAAVAFVTAAKQSSPSLGVRLLADLRTVFGPRDAMHTSAILDALVTLEEAPWGEIVAGKPLNSRGLSKRLGAYEVKSKSVRVGEKVERGYSRADLADAWSRYLPPPASDGEGESFTPEPDAETPAPGTLSLFPKESVTSVTTVTNADNVPLDGAPNPDTVTVVTDVTDFKRERERPSPPSFSPEAKQQSHEDEATAPSGCGAPESCAKLGPCPFYMDHGRCWGDESPESETESADDSAATDELGGYEASADPEADEEAPWSVEPPLPTDCGNPSYCARFGACAPHSWQGQCYRNEPDDLPYHQPHIAVCSLGKRRWYWIAVRSYYVWMDLACERLSREDAILGSGYETSKPEAEAAARAVAGQAAGVLPAGWASQDHRQLVAKRRMAEAGSRNAGAEGTTTAEYAWAWWYPHEDSEGHWIRHRIVKRTAKRIYLEQKHDGYHGDTGWRAFDQRTTVIDRQAFERDGFAPANHDVFHYCADGFYAAPDDRDTRRWSGPTPSCLALLGLDAPCTRRDVERAYRRLAKACHPDSGGDGERFIAVRDAYDQALCVVPSTERAPWGVARDDRWTR